MTISINNIGMMYNREILVMDRSSGNVYIYYFANIRGWGPRTKRKVDLVQ